jgi:O-antigen ligase
LEIAGTEGGIDRETMFGANPNTFAFLEVLGIVIIVGIVVENPCAFGKWRFLALATVPLLLKASFMTGSRGALVSLALGLTPFFFTRNTARLRVLIWLLLIGCGLLITFYVKNSDILMERMERTIEKGNTAGRLELWQVAVERIAEKPFSGWGFTGMIRCFNEVSDVSDPHNVFLTMFLLTGIFGGIFFLMLAARWIFQALAARQTVWGCIPLALAVVVLSLFFKGGGAYSLKVAWLMLACVAAMGDRRYSMIDWDRKPFVKATGEPEIMKRDKTF